jgi:hypothetical protein
MQRDLILLADTVTANCRGPSVRYIMGSDGIVLSRMVYLACIELWL